MARETARLLEAWREAERAAGAAHLAAEHAREAAEAATHAAAPARPAAEDAGVTVNAADRVATGAKKAYRNHEAAILAEEGKKRPRGLPGGLGEAT